MKNLLLFALAVAAGVVFGQQWIDAAGGRSGTVWRVDLKSVATVSNGPRPRLVAAVRTEVAGAVTGEWAASVDPAGCAAPRGLIVLSRRDAEEVVELVYGRDDGTVAQALGASICKAAGHGKK